MSQNVNDLGATQTLDNVLAAILREADAGAVPNRAEWLTRYPQFAEALGDFFADEDRVGRWTAPLREAAASTRTEAATVGAESAGVAAPAGRFIGDYEILEEIGQGGMGIVYRARQRRLNRLVALKTVRAGEFASEADRLRFHNEAEVVGQMDHPHIVPIYEVGETQGQHYFSMKLVEGPSLAGWIADHRSPMADLPIEQQRGIARLIATVARAVHHAHQRGILHRDLKPANILLLPATGSAIDNLHAAIPLVTDFGLAKRVEEAVQPAEAGATAVRNPITQSGAIVGTPSYMAPEQAGAGKALSTAVDTYSLGAILYELLTGRPPVQGATVLDTLLLVMGPDPVVPPRKVNPRVDGDLETICLKCLDKDPQRRYSSAEELAKDVERWLVGEPIQARRAGRGERLVKWSKRRPAAAAALAIAVASFAVLLTLAGFLWQNAEARAAAVRSLDEAKLKIADADGELEEKDHALQAKNNEIKDKGQELERLQKLAREAGTLAEKARERGDGILYDADMQFAHAAWHIDDVSGMLRILEDHRPKAGQPDRRGFEWHYLWRLAHGNGFTLLAHPAKDRALSAPLDKVLGDIPSASFHPVLTALSPDGKVLASTGGDQKIKLWHADTGKLMRTLPGVSTAVSLGFTPDGQSLVLVNGRAIDLAQAMNGQAIQDALSGKVKPSLDGLKSGLVMRTLNLDGDKPGPETPLDPARLVAPVNIIAAGEALIGLTVRAMIPLEGGGGFFSPMCLAVAPDKKTLALGGMATTVSGAAPGMVNKIQQEGAMLLWDLTTARPKKFFKGESTMVTTVVFSPDGRTLASAAWRTVKLWDPITLQQRATLNGQSTPVFAMAFSAKGTQVLVGTLDGVVKLWDVATNEVQATFKGHQNSISSVAISPDGRTVFAAGVDGTIKSWDARKAAPSQFRTNVLDLAFSPDGKVLNGIDRNGTIKRIDLGSGKENETQVGLNFQLRSSAMFSRDCQTVALIDRTLGMVKTFDLITDLERLRVKVNAIPAPVVCLSPDGSTLALAAGDAKTWQIQLWNANTAKLERTLPGGAGSVKCLAFAPDGKTLAGGGTDQIVRLWDLTTAQVRLTMPANSQATGLVYSPDGKRIAVAERGNVRLVDAATGNELLVLHGSLPVLGMSFSPDGRRLATSGGDAELGRGFGVKLWDMASGREVLNLARPTDVVTQVIFSPDGNRLAAALSGDAITGPIFNMASPAEVKIWSAAP